jgi:hypothetical protein
VNYRIRGVAMGRDGANELTVGIIGREALICRCPRRWPRVDFWPSRPPHCRTLWR